MQCESVVPVGTFGCSEPRRPVAGGQPRSERRTLASTSPRSSGERKPRPRGAALEAIGDDEHVRAQFRERVGDRESGDREAEHGDLHPLQFQPGTGLTHDQKEPR